MTTVKDECPGVGTGALEDHLRGSTSNYLTPIGSTVEKQLDNTLWQLIAGEVELHECTPALLAWWTLAFDQGRASMQDRIERLNFEADLWFWCYSNRKAPGDFRKAATDRLWAEAVTS